MQPSDVEAYRIASLRRILAEAVSRGSVRKVLGAFVEALGVWDDLRVDAYAAGATGGFFRYVSPVGAPVSPAPSELNADAVPRGEAIVRCSREDLDRIGVAAESRDTWVQRIATRDIDWVLLLTGAIDDAEQDRLTRYAEILREALNDAMERTIARVVAAMPKEPLPPNDALIEATQAVVAQLTAFVSGHRSALTVSSATGRPILAAGSADLLQML